MATTSGTWGYRDRFGDAFGRTYFRRFGPGVVSSVGVGTYLGDPTDDADDRYREAVRTALDAGVNVVDTAVNYRAGRSERVVGEALAESSADRDEVLVATKGGFLPFDGERPEEPAAYVRREFVEPGLVDPDDLVRGSHCIAPDFLDAMVDRSLSNLDLDAVDLYYVHNPETQLTEHPRDEVYDRLEAAFETLERRVAAGDVGAYGVATWEAFRMPEGHDSYLSLPAVVARAEAAAETVHGDGASHGFEAVQLPFNVGMADAFSLKNQRKPESGDSVSTLEYAHDAGLGMFTSASLSQGELAREGVIPDDVAALLEGDSAAQRAINFARSAPGVTCSLVGMGSPEHVAENVAAGTFDPLGAQAFDSTFE
ncbi:aldo/keto reductase [Halobium salinum]|uniref:Aldo/keto reductase n=1 Tax=Halobium salinum TaxID=1364940 RepID=A0ABD5PD05_9EURY|nr:aldo/keto reductase [Halobium salinum]